MTTALPMLPTSDTARPDRAIAVHAGVRVEQVTIGWMVIEALGGDWRRGTVARSLLLTAFGLDSVIELVTGGVLLCAGSRGARGGSPGDA